MSWSAEDCICVALPDMLHTALTLLVLEALCGGPWCNSFGWMQLNMYSIHIHIYKCIGAYMI